MLTLVCILNCLVQLYATSLMLSNAMFSDLGLVPDRGGKSRAARMKIDSVRPDAGAWIVQLWMIAIS